MNKTLREQLNAVLAEVQTIADGAKGADGQRRDFTTAEGTRLAELKSCADQLKPKIAEADAAKALADELAASSGDADERVAGTFTKSRTPSRTTSPLAKAFIDALPVSGGHKSIAPAGQVTLPTQLGMVPLVERPDSLQQLCSVQVVESDTFVYLRQTLRTNNAAPVPIGQTKPTSLYNIEMQNGQVPTIAHLTEGVPKQWLADVGILQQWLTSELAYGVSRAVDALILNGDAASSTEGILGADGVLQVAYATDALVSIRSALTRLAEAGESPSAVVVSPADWQIIETLRDASERFVMPNVPNASATPSLFGVPVVQNNDLPAGKALVGDFKTVILAVRQQVTVDWSDAGTELFDKNLIKFRGECRTGVGVTRPGALAVVDVVSQ